MEFPITRETLQAYTAESLQAEEHEKNLQLVLGKMLDTCCADFKSSMRANLKEEKFVWIDLKGKQREAILNNLSLRFEQVGIQSVASGIQLCSEPDFAPQHRNPRLWNQPPQIQRHEALQRIHSVDLIPRFIEKLKATFIGCEIIVDPLKTYVIIDWS